MKPTLGRSRLSSRERPRLNSACDSGIRSRKNRPHGIEVDSNKRPAAMPSPISRSPMRQKPPTFNHDQSLLAAANGKFQLASDAACTPCQAVTGPPKKKHAARIMPATIFQRLGANDSENLPGTESLSDAVPVVTIQAWPSRKIRPRHVKEHGGGEAEGVDAVEQTAVLIRQCTVILYHGRA